MIFLGGFGAAELMGRKWRSTRVVGDFCGATIGELLQTPHHFASGTTDYITPLSHNQSAKNPYHTLPQQLHYYHYSNYILSTTTIKTSLSLIPFLIIYISSYTLHERIIWPISPQFKHFNSALFLIICWSDVLLI
jgi:hypothetical protein